MESHQCLSEMLQESTFLQKTDAPAHSFPEIDMTSILGSLPACFLKARQWGSEDQYFYPTCQISDVISKSSDGPIDVCFVSTLT